jgi:hypothetical protein
MANWNDGTATWNSGTETWNSGSGPTLFTLNLGGSLSPSAVITKVFHGVNLKSLGGSISPAGVAGHDSEPPPFLPSPKPKQTVPYAVNTIPIGIGAVTDAQDAFFGATGRAFRRVDIYEADGTTLWLQDAPVLEGSVTVDMNRAERRMGELTFDNHDNRFRSDPGGFWYDKIVKIYRGVQDKDDSTQIYQLGEFMIDRITCPNVPPVARVTVRDYTKKLQKAKFSEATGFASGVPLDQAIVGILVSGGVTRYNIPNAGIPLDRDFYFEAGTERWEAISQLATSFGYEVFFDQGGTFTMRLFVDPTTAPVQFTFFTGLEGNLSSYELSTEDSRIFNHIVVVGSASDILPVYGIAENTEPSSPTRIARLGRRTYPYDSKFISTQPQAQQLADQFLKIMALESYELELDALVAPWLETGVAVQFVDPNPAPEAPNRFLLTNFTIPMKVGTMSASAKRVTIVQ